MVPLNKGNCRLIVATLLEAKKGEAEGIGRKSNLGRSAILFLCFLSLQQLISISI